MDVDGAEDKNASVVRRPSSRSTSKAQLAPSHGQSIIGYDRASRGGVAYLGLAGEVLRRQRERDQQQAKEKAA